MAVEWEDPVTAKRNPETYAEAAAELRLRPGQWAVILRVENAVENPRDAQYARTLATNIRGGNYAAFRPVGHWEATVRTVNSPAKGKVITVYARYTGPAA